MTATAAEPRWYRATTAAPARGVVLTVHGLNFKPQGMEHLVGEFTSRGYDVLLVGLKGHEGGDLEAFKRVKREDWLSEVRHGYELLVERHHQTGGERVFVAASLGAQLGIELMGTRDTSRPVDFDRMVLFAPALAVKPLPGNATRLLLVTGAEGILIPSLCPAEYRAHRGTPVGAYRALFQGLERISGRSFDAVGADIPTTVFVDPEDELVSLPGLRAFVRQQAFIRWNIVEVSNSQSQYRRPYHHLITDPEVLGEREWADKVLPRLLQRQGP